MRIELEPGIDGLDAAALRKALHDAGIALDAQPQASAGPWARAALREAVENEPTSRRSRLAPYGQALSPRSTRGATRA